MMRLVKREMSSLL